MGCSRTKTLTYPRVLENHLDIPWLWAVCTKALAYPRVCLRTVGTELVVPEEHAEIRNVNALGARFPRTVCFNSTPRSISEMVHARTPSRTPFHMPLTLKHHLI